MSVLAAARPWHYWISVLLVLSVALGIVATLVGYYVKVISQKFPRQ